MSPLGLILISAIIFFMAPVFSERNELSFGSTVRVLVGSCARAKDVVVTDTAVASESTRLRMKARESKTIVVSGHYQPSPERMAPWLRLECYRYILRITQPTPDSATAFPGCV